MVFYQEYSRIRYAKS